RVVEAVDDVEHRGLAGAVGPDDGANLALADVERDAGDRLDAAEGERDVLDREQHIAGGDLLPARGRSSHAAYSRSRGTGAVATSRTFTRAESVPLRPSS